MGDMVDALVDSGGIFLEAGQYLEALGERIGRSVGLLAERLSREALGDYALHGVIGSLAATLVLLALTAPVVLGVRWLVFRSTRARNTWLQGLAQAATSPLCAGIWLVGLFFAFSPLLVRVHTSGAFPAGIALAGIVVRVGTAGILLWFVMRLLRVVETVATRWAERTEGKTDDILIGFGVRVGKNLVAVVGLIVVVDFLPLPGFFAPYERTALSMLLIGTFAWLFTQAVLAAENLILCRYDVSSERDLQARRVSTQLTVLRKILISIIVIFAVASILMLFEPIRQFGTSILASAGVVGVVVGFAAQKTIGNLFAGLQIALTQPIRLGDAVIVEGEWGRIDEITLTYVVVALWDQRHLVLPISYFIEKPFQNWTRSSTEILGTVFLHTDYTIPVAEVREELFRLCRENPNWDGRVANLQVTAAKETTLELRATVSSADAAKNADLRCELREHLVAFIRTRHPHCLPHLRVETRPRRVRARSRVASVQLTWPAELEESRS